MAFEAIDMAENTDEFRAYNLKRSCLISQREELLQKGNRLNVEARHKREEANECFDQADQIERQLRIMP